jgi:type II secretory pathway pseudopilin PulG
MHAEAPRAFILIRLQLSWGVRPRGKEQIKGQTLRRAWRSHKHSSDFQMDRFKKTLPELALESAMIIFSVLLALAANGWSDARKEARVTSQSRDAFIQEVRANRGRILRALPYHRDLTAAVLPVDSSGGVSSYAAWRRRVPIWSGFAPPDLAATAWQSALATGALSRLPYREVAALSNVYTIQTRFDTFNAGYLPLFDFSDGAMGGTVRRMSAYMQTILSYETAMLRGYDSSLVVLGASDPSR